MHKVLRFRIPIIILIFNLSISNSVFGLTGTSVAMHVHDPSLIRVGKLTYSFSTGFAAPIKLSKTTDTTMYSSWTFVKNVPGFSMPTWIAPYFTARGLKIPDNLWSPDINFWNGKYYMYYASSVWNTDYAVCGLATADNIEGPWTDQGLVTDLNYPIDPHVVWDNSVPYLIWGSWTGSGIYMRQIDPATGKLSTLNTSMSQIATGIEGASLLKHGGYYYLFASKGACCSGINSTYYTVVARSTSRTGPFTSFKTLLSTNGTEIGTGGGDWFIVDSTYYFGYHFYDGNNNGVSALNIRKMNFVDGWPVFYNPITTYPIIYSYSAQQNENPANNIRDNNTNDSSRWSAEGFPQWIVIDYGKEMNIAGYQLWTYMSRAYQFKVDVSNDPTFKTFVQSDRTSNTSTTQPISGLITANGRYIRITIEGVSGYAGNWVSLNEFKILEKSNGLHAQEFNRSFVFPNPVEKELFILTDVVPMSVYKLRVFNMLGQCFIHKTIVNDENFVVNVGNLKTGIYTVILSNKYKTFTTKFLKK